MESKARCSARDDKMIPHVHFNPEKTVTYMADKTTVRLLFAMAASFNMFIEHIDIRQRTYTKSLITQEANQCLSDNISDLTAHTNMNTELVNCTKTYTAHPVQDTPTSGPSSNYSANTNLRNQKPTCASSTAAPRTTSSLYQ